MFFILKLYEPLKLQLVFGWHKVLKVRTGLYKATPVASWHNFRLRMSVIMFALTDDCGCAG